MARSRVYSAAWQLTVYITGRRICEDGMQNINVGKKVRRYRQQRGTTRRELASLAEITPSMLTQIEKAQATPSINTMKAIAQALEITVLSFFSF